MKTQIKNLTDRNIRLPNGTVIESWKQKVRQILEVATSVQIWSPHSLWSALKVHDYEVDWNELLNYFYELREQGFVIQEMPDMYRWVDEATPHEHQQFWSECTIGCGNQDCAFGCRSGKRHSEVP